MPVYVYVLCSVRTMHSTYIKTSVYLGLSVPCCLYCMLQGRRAIGLQTDCMVAVPEPVVRLPDSYVNS